MIDGEQIENLKQVLTDLSSEDTQKYFNDITKSSKRNYYNNLWIQGIVLLITAIIFIYTLKSSIEKVEIVVSNNMKQIDEIKKEKCDRTELLNIAKEINEIKKEKGDKVELQSVDKRLDRLENKYLYNNEKRN